MAESDNFEDGNRDESAIVFGQEEGGEKGEKKGTITNRQMAIFHVELFGICSLDSSLLAPFGISHRTASRLQVHSQMEK